MIMIDCLSNMSVQGDESSLMEYTRKWTLRVNRGGLFEINDMTYNLFKEIELKFVTTCLYHFTGNLVKVGKQL